MRKKVEMSQLPQHLWLLTPPTMSLMPSTDTSQSIICPPSCNFVFSNSFAKTDHFHAKKYHRLFSAHTFHSQVSVTCEPQTISPPGFLWQEVHNAQLLFYFLGNFTRAVKWHSLLHTEKKSPITFNSHCWIRKIIIHFTFVQKKFLP